MLIALNSGVPDFVPFNSAIWVVVNVTPDDSRRRHARVAVDVEWNASASTADRPKAVRHQVERRLLDANMRFDSREQHLVNAAGLPVVKQTAALAATEGRLGGDRLELRGELRHGRARPCGYCSVARATLSTSAPSISSADVPNDPLVIGHERDQLPLHVDDEQTGYCRPT